MQLRANDIANIMKLSSSLVSSVLGNYRFNQFYRLGWYNITNEFITTLDEFLKLRKRDYTKEVARLKIWKNKQCK